MLFTGAVIITGVTGDWWPDRPVAAGLRQALAMVVVAGQATSVFRSLPLVGFHLWAMRIGRINALFHQDIQYYREYREYDDTLPVDNPH